MAKRAFDFIVAGILLILLSPLLLTITATIRLLLGSPVLFTQTRPGLNGRPFRIVKFRTMTEARGPDRRLLPDTERLTPLGRCLRAASLDELPELWNVIRGEMSLVGPRPLLMEYLPLYSPDQARRHDIRPGIAGWAQVNGRNTLSWEEKFALDLWYVENRDFWLDLRILFLTVGSVIRREGISAAGHAATPPFEGGPNRLP